MISVNKRWDKKLNVHIKNSLRCSEDAQEMLFLDFLHSQEILLRKKQTNALNIRAILVSLNGENQTSVYHKWLLVNVDLKFTKT